MLQSQSFPSLVHALHKLSNIDDSALPRQVDEADRLRVEMVAFLGIHQQIAHELSHQMCGIISTGQHYPVKKVLQQDPAIGL